MSLILFFYFNYDNVYVKSNLVDYSVSIFSSSLITSRDCYKCEFVSLEEFFYENIVGESFDLLLATDIGEQCYIVLLLTENPLIIIGDAIVLIGDILFWVLTPRFLVL